MVDRTSRDGLAKAVRRLAAGLITNHEFDAVSAAFAQSRDLGVRSLRMAAWTLYDDLHEYRLEGSNRLGKVERRQLARWIIFLKSNLEYEWPNLMARPWLILALPNLLTFGMIGRLVQRWHDRRGDAAAWPFLRAHDLRHAATAWPAHSRRPGEMLGG